MRSLHNSLMRSRKHRQDSKKWVILETSTMLWIVRRAGDESRLEGKHAIGPAGLNTFVSGVIARESHINSKGVA